MNSNTINKFLFLFLAGTFIGNIGFCQEFKAAESSDKVSIERKVQAKQEILKDVSSQSKKDVIANRKPNANIDTTVVAGPPPKELIESRKKKK
jgi:hypothetical protein